MRTLIQEENRTLIDDTDYNISHSEAIVRLMRGQSIIAQPHPNYDSDDLDDLCPAAEILKGKNFHKMSINEVTEYLRSYCQFGEYK